TSRWAISTSHESSSRRPEGTPLQVRRINLALAGVAQATRRSGSSGTRAAGQAIARTIASPRRLARCFRAFLLGIEKVAEVKLGTLDSSGSRQSERLP